MDDCVVALPVAATDSGIGGASAGGAGGIIGAGGGIGSTEGGTGGTGGSSNKAAGRSAVAGAGDDGDGDGVSGDDDNTDDETKKKKRRRAAQTTEELRVATVMKATCRYNAIAKGYEWVVNSKEALDKYLLDGAMSCKLCHSSFGVGTNTGNVSKHATTVKHTEKEAAARGPGLNAYFTAKPEPRMLSQTERLQKTVLLGEVRALTTAAAIGRGMPPHQITQVFCKGGLVRKALAALEREDVSLGAAGTMAADLPKAEAILREGMRKIMKGVYGCITQDGATFGSDKVLAVCFDSQQLDKGEKNGGVVFLDLIFPEENSEVPPGHKDRFKYDAKRAAQDVKRVMDGYQISLNQVTVAMGDNASFCSAFAREMGLVQGKDPAHALALLLKKPLTRLLPLFKNLVVDLSSVLRAGGGTRRISELAELGLDTNKLKAYPNRFCSMQTSAKYVEENFDVIKTWVASSAYMPRVPGIVAGAAAAPAALGGVFADDEEEGEEDEDEDDDEEDILRKSEAQAARVVKAFYHKLALPSLRMAHSLYGKVPELVNDLSGANGYVPPDLLPRLKALRLALNEAKTNPNSVVGPALRGGIQITQQQKNLLMSSVVEAAEFSLHKFEVHLKPWLVCQTYKNLYEPRVLPTPFPPATDAAGNETDYKLFLGCFEEDMGPDLVAQYKAYVEEVTALHQSDEVLPDEDKKVPKLNAAQFWERKRATNTMKELSNIALWHTAMPIGAICCERVVARLRQQDVPVRLNAANATVARELSFKCNIRLLDSELDTRLRKLAALS